MIKTVCMVALLACLGGCSDECGNSQVMSARSPDLRRTAVVFQRDCGATNGFSTQISILAEGERVSGVGNLFSADDDHGAAPSAKWGGPQVELRWLSADRLLVKYDPRARIFKREPSVAGVKVSYVTFPTQR